jgi:hypothetical protein
MVWSHSFSTNNPLTWGEETHPLFYIEKEIIICMVQKCEIA